MKISAAIDNLKDQTEADLREALACSKASNKALVARETPGKHCIVDFLFARIPGDIIDVLNERAPLADAENMETGPITLGELIRKTGSLGKTIKRVDYSRYVLKRIWSEEKADYLAELLFLLQQVKAVILESRDISSGSSPKHQEYCTLCWRLVNKYRLVNYENSLISSSLYCCVHHPKGVEKVHKRAVRRLTTASKSRNTEFDIWVQEALASGKTPRATKANLRSRLKFSFADLPSPSIKGPLFQPVETWHERRDQILSLAAECYPETSKCISGISGTNWESWFLGVIRQLDKSGIAKIKVKLSGEELAKFSRLENQDFENWESSDDFKLVRNEPSVESTYDSDLTGWSVLLAIFHRHEAVCNIEEMPRRRRNNVKVK